MDKTLLILGAGASKDFCRIFPTGLELIKEINYHFLTENKFPKVPESEGVYLSALMNDISRVFGNDCYLFNKIKNSLWEIQLNYEYQSLRNKITEPVSIDNFIAAKIQEGELDARAADIIKYSIYYLIKGTEQALSEGDYDLQENWIEDLVTKLSKYDIDTIIKNLIVLTYNYDRVFERYFIKYLMEIFNLSEVQISQLNDNIIHVYGSLGKLSEISFELKNEAVQIIRNKFNNIKLIGDRSNIVLPISSKEMYKKLFFIGFGYDKTNLELLDLNQFQAASLHGTAYYYTDAQIDKLKTEYRIESKNISCKDFLRELIL